MAVGVSGQEQAYYFASTSKTWSVLRSQWWSCMAKQGLTPDKNPQDWVPVIPTDPQAAIRAGLIDVACKTQLNFVQQLADLESEYEAAYVAQN